MKVLTPFNYLTTNSAIFTVSKVKLHNEEMWSPIRGVKDHQIKEQLLAEIIIIQTMWWKFWLSAFSFTKKRNKMGCTIWMHPGSNWDSFLCLKRAAFNLRFSLIKQALCLKSVWWQICCFHWPDILGVPPVALWCSEAGSLALK